MTADPYPTQLEPSDEAWQQIEHLLEEIAQLAKSDQSPREFYDEVLGRTIRALSAVAGAVWVKGPGGALYLESQINLASTTVLADANHQRHHDRLLEEVLNSGEARLLPPNAGDVSGAPTANPTQQLLIVYPLNDQHEPWGVIEIFQRPESSAAAQRGYVRFLEAVCELIADFQRNSLLKDLRNRESLWSQLEGFSRLVHQSLDIRRTAYVIANEGRRILDCDRLSVVTWQAARAKLAAISGVDSWEPRASSVRWLEKLTGLVLATEQPFWYADQSDDVPPEIEPTLQGYLEESHARMLAILPLRESTENDQEIVQPCCGALVVEQFDAAPSSSLPQRAAAVGAYSTSALKNALEIHNVPLFRLGQWLHRVGWIARGSQLPKTVVALVATMLLVLAMVLIPASYYVEAPGELQPSARRDVFAIADGSVDQLLVEHGQSVHAGEIVVVLRNPQLAYEFRRLSGEIQTARKRLAAVQATRIENRAPGSSDRDTYHRLTSEEEELKQHIQSLQQQYKIVEEQQEDLSIRSPIDGQVLTWNLKQLLEARPVRRGETMMTVGKLDGPWVAELRIPDRRMGHVLRAQQQAGARLDVTFVLGTEPNVPHQGTLQTIALSTDVDETFGTNVLATVVFDRAGIARLRQGATLKAKIYCGRRSIGYVWLHDLLDAVKSWMVF